MVGVVRFAGLSGMDMEETRKLPNHSANRSSCLCQIVTFCLLCSCATAPVSTPVALPPEVPLNAGAGKGDPIFVTLSLNGDKELLFVMDTGATGTFLDSSLAPELGKALRQVQILDNTTGRGKVVALYKAPPLFLGETRLATGREVGVVDFSLLRRVAGRPIMGVLGMDCLSHYCLQLDFAANKLRFLKPQLTNGAELGRAFAVKFPTGIPVVAGNVLGVQGFDTIVDTGDTGSGALGTSLVKKSPGRASSLMTNGLAASLSGAHAEAKGRFTNCTFGEEKYDLILSENSTTSVGLAFLARHEVTFDFPGRKMYLKLRGDGRRPDPGEDVGLSLVRDGDETTIFAVDPKGPGDRAGIAAGDVLLAINGNAVGALEMWQVKKLIHSGENKELTFSMRRHGQTQDIKIAPTKF